MTLVVGMTIFQAATDAEPEPDLNLVLGDWLRTHRVPAGVRAPSPVRDWMSVSGLRAGCR
jgi:hypothetical protein